MNDIKNVCVYSASSTQIAPAYFEAATQLGRLLAIKGINLINGAGSIGLMAPAQSHLSIREDEIEVGYWIGVPFWGNGYIPEAVSRIQQYVFEELEYSAMWCGYYDGNTKSKRVQEKIGFSYHHTCDEVPVTLLNEVRVGHTNYMTLEMWNSYGSA